MNTIQQTVTRLLQRAGEGDRESLGGLFPLVYEELRQIARRHRRGGMETLNTTALVHEAYIKLVDQTRPDWQSRAHFLAVASKAMRHILIDHARRTGAAKRGGGGVPVELDALEEGRVRAEGWAVADRDDLLALDQALERLEGENERLVRIVEMKFFGGMTTDEIASALAISPATVKRGWSLAQAWLYREMEPSREPRS